VNDRFQAIGFLSLLVLTGIAAWWLSLRPLPASDGATLRGLPAELAGWKAVDIPMEQDVADMLRADANVQRAYIHPLGYVVYVYVGYYGTARQCSVEIQHKAAGCAQPLNYLCGHASSRLRQVASGTSARFRQPAHRPVPSESA
jgi:Protein of unknown function (DUF3485)